MPKADHIHRYKRVNLSSKETPYWVYKCTKPMCSHYLPLTLVEGQVCECNLCFQPMIINKEVLTRSNGGPMARPRCTNCIKRKKNDAVDAIAAFLEGNKT